MLITSWQDDIIDTLHYAVTVALYNTNGGKLVWFGNQEQGPGFLEEMDLHNALASFSLETKVKDKQESIDLELLQIMRHSV